MENSNTTILIAGATGYLGKHLIKVSKRSGFKVHALCRNADKLKPLKSEIDKLIVADVTQPKSLTSVFRSIDIVISALGITRQKDGLSYWDVDYQANKNILDCAVEAGVKQFGYVHVLNADKMQKVELVKAKSAFVFALQAAPIKSTICCPSGFYSDLAEFYSMAQKGRVYLFGNGLNKISPIEGQDAAQACLEAVLKQTPWVDIGGPETYSQNDLARLAFEALGQTENITRIPYTPAQIVLKLLKICDFRKRLGPLEFFLMASGIDMSAPSNGRLTVRQYFEALSASDLERQYLDMAGAVS